MPLVKGANCGFLLASPTVDPNAGASGTQDGYTAVQNFTSPAGNNKIIELGWYQNSGSNDVAAYSMGVYDDVSGPNILITAQSIGNSTVANTAGWYKYTGLNIPIDAETVYWIGVGQEAVTGANSIDREASQGLGDIRHYGSLGSAPNYLTDPYASSGSGDYLLAYYAVYEAISTKHTVTFIEGENGSINGTLIQEVDHGESATEVIAEGNNGYVFNGWTGDHIGIEHSLILINVIDDMVVTANFGEWNISNVNYAARIAAKECFFSGLSVPGYSENFCQCKTSPFPLLSGVRESIYGLATQEATHEEWNNAFWGMHWRVGRAPKIGLFNISAIIGNDCRFNFVNPGGVSDPNITFTGTDTQEAMFTNFDGDGDIDIYLGIELGEADPTEAIEVALNRYGSHSCVAGIVIDLEWWDVNGTGNYTVQLTKAMAESWLSTIQGYDIEYKLLLRHPNPDILPPNNPDFNTDIWCICDDQGFIGLNGTGDYMIPMFQAFVDQFPNHTVILQIGYNDIWYDGGETRNDKTWWGGYADPPGIIAQAIIDNIASMDQTIGIVWVDFSLEDIEIDLLDTPNLTELADGCPLHSNNYSGMHIPVNAPIHSSQYDKQKYL